MTSTDVGVSGEGHVEDVASGQRMVIAAVLVTIVAGVLQVAVDDAFALLGLVGVIIAIIGLLKLGRGLQYSSVKRGVLIVLAFIPLVSLVMLVYVNAQATEALRSAGHEVGFFGVRR